MSQMQHRPNPLLVSVPRGEPDPGNRRAGLIAMVIAAVCFLTVVFMNQVSSAPSSTKRAAQTMAHEQAVDLADPTTLAMKMVVKLAHLFNPKDEAARRDWLAQAQPPTTDPNSRPETERVRQAIVHAEILKGNDGAKDAERLFGQMEDEFAGRAERLNRDLSEDEKKLIDAARQDIATLRKIYAGDRATLSEDERSRLATRHGWFGELALTFGEDDQSPQRTALLAGGGALIGGVLFVITAALVAVCGGFGCFVAMIVLMSTGKIRRNFAPPSPGGSFGWEVLAAFLVAFLGFKIVASVLVTLLAGDHPPPWFPKVVLGGQLLVAVAVLFPLLRGVRFDQYRRLVGWTADRGVMREVMAGVFGYFAGLPVIFAALMFSLALNFLLHWWKGVEPEQPENPILEIAGRGDALLLTLLFVLATVWAPIVEETVFRGSVYRAMRARVGVLLAAAGSALIFGFMHGYPVQLLGPVIGIGFVFALMREWRGSIIGPMVAHFLNNATILVMVFLILTAAA
ncbi:MAG: CPBP family intramembrane metalloprotease [Planctomycetes bacterium]|nr:CPBP family intramembrane metalloprotease [Planctomycetota bacterium]